MKHSLYKQIISVILQVSLVGASVLPSFAQYFSLAAPGDRELNSSLVEPDFVNMNKNEIVPIFSPAPVERKKSSAMLFDNLGYRLIILGVIFAVFAAVLIDIFVPGNNLVYVVVSCIFVAATFYAAYIYKKFTSIEHIGWETGKGKWLDLRVRHKAWKGRVKRDMTAEDYKKIINMFLYPFTILITFGSFIMNMFLLITAKYIGEYVILTAMDISCFCLFFMSSHNFYTKLINFRTRHVYIYWLSQMRLIRFIFDVLNFPYDYAHSNTNLNTITDLFFWMIGHPPENEDKLYKQLESINHSLSGVMPFFILKRLKTKALLKKTHLTVGFVLKDALHSDWFFKQSPAIVTDLMSLAYLLYKRGASYNEVLGELRGRLELDELFDFIYSKQKGFPLSGNEIQKDNLPKLQRNRIQRLIHKLGFGGNTFSESVEASIAPSYCPQILINNVNTLKELSVIEGSDLSHHISIDSTDDDQLYVSNITACMWVLRDTKVRLYENWANPILYDYKGIVFNSKKVIRQLKKDGRQSRWEIRALRFGKTFYEDIWICTLLMSQIFREQFGDIFFQKVSDLWHKYGLPQEGNMDLSGSIKMPNFRERNIYRAGFKAAKLPAYKNLCWLKKTAMTHPEIIDEIKSILKEYLIPVHRNIIIRFLSKDRYKNYEETDWSDLSSLVKRRCEAPEDSDKEISAIALSLAILDRLQVRQAEEIVKNCGIGKKFSNFREMLELTELGVVVLRRSGSAENISGLVNRLTQHQKSTNGSVLSSN